MSKWYAIKSIFPILNWSKKYNEEKAFADLIAAITLALTLIPQSIAYASLAGLDPQYGLYAAFPGNFVYAIMGRCPQVSIGPTSLLSLLTCVYTEGTNKDFAIFLCFFVGVVMLTAGVAQLGFLIDYVSIPVVSGFTTAAAVTIASSQIKTLLGIQFSSKGSFFDGWVKLIQNITRLKKADTLLSAGCITTLLVTDLLALKAHKFKKVLFYLSLAKNAIVVVIASVIASFIYVDLKNPLIITGPVTQGLPEPKLPPFQTNLNGTEYGIMDMVEKVNFGILVIPLVGIISNVAIAKSFAKRKRLKATQEIIALGFCNIVGSFFQSYPVTGAFSRSAISQSSGVKTPASAIFTGLLVMLTLVLLTPWFFYIPKASLACVIVHAVLKLVQLSICKRIWDVNRIDLITLWGTFCCALIFGIEMAIICGVAIDLFLLIIKYSPSKLDIKYVDNGVQEPHYAVRLIGGFKFHVAEKTRTNLKSLLYRTQSKNLARSDNTMETLNDEPNGKAGNGSRPSDTKLSSRVGRRGICTVLVMYCDKLARVDYTFLQSMKSLVTVWPQDGKIIWCDLPPDIKVKFERVARDLTYCDSGQQLDALLSGPRTSAKLSQDTDDFED